MMFQPSLVHTLCAYIVATAHCNCSLCALSHSKSVPTGRNFHRFSHVVGIFPKIISNVFNFSNFEFSKIRVIPIWAKISTNSLLLSIFSQKSPPDRFLLANFNISFHIPNSAKNKMFKFFPPPRFQGLHVVSTRENGKQNEI